MCKTSEERKKEHALHVCDVELDEKFPHADHTGIQTKGPHQFWVCAAEGNPMMYEGDKAAISAWLDAKQVKFGGGQDKIYALLYLPLLSNQIGSTNVWTCHVCEEIKEQDPVAKTQKHICQTCARQRRRKKKGTDEPELRLGVRCRTADPRYIIFNH